MEYKVFGKEKGGKKLTTPQHPHMTCLPNCSCTTTSTCTYSFYLSRSYPSPISNRNHSPFNYITINKISNNSSSPLCLTIATLYTPAILIKLKPVTDNVNKEITSWLKIASLSCSFCGRTDQVGVCSANAVHWRWRWQVIKWSLVRPAACMKEWTTVGPTDLNPLLTMSLLMLSDFDVFAGIL